MSRMPTKLLVELTEEFWSMRSKFKSETLSSGTGRLWFDYPNYYGLSSKVKSRLTGDFVDSLQSELFYELEYGGIEIYKKFFRSKRDLHRNLIKIWKIYSY